MGRPAVAVKSSMKKEWTVQELERSSQGSVYVVNTSPKGRRGDILFSCPKLNGSGQDIVKIVKTWIPQDLTNQVTKQQLLGSSEFRKSVQKRILRIASPEYAELILSQNDAQEEQERIANMQDAARNILRAGQVTEKDEDDEDYDSPTKKRRRAAAAKAEAGNTGKTHLDFGQSSFDVLLTSLEGKSGTEVLNALKSEGQLSIIELKKAFKKFGEIAKVGVWIEKKLDALE